MRRRRHYPEFDEFDDDPDEPAEAPLPPLAERMPIYLAVFAVGVGVTLVIGLLWGGLADISVTDAVAYSMMLYGVGLLMVGGASGGGYSNLSLGAAGALFGGRHRRPDEIEDDPDARRGARVRVDPMERLRKGLRPEANPTAFWQVVGGFAYIALGIGVAELIG